ncbi:NAD-dependent epimerase/dehydratase family protein [Wenyingzhuangia marina]|uniref:Nucleoside-diphosphate-sugar epimerase n=2 Tax=Wenyingzhuangia marina TaxID=1195760 RepID=A0A1M5X2V2_9FLAO|nr:NAD-dependent epimerase/dehydratase family protein [Wenyingzhuangia marina]GGF60872.1 nucleoside-diphosphate-sugar epimerase [Wenyingzhuangia marina]SHH93523.1 Nucleoside-diphosphate-sugar epimerase [Wenyingzhuangia marina]
MLNIIITGGSGFVGGNLFKYFKNQKRIFLNISRTPKKGELSYENLKMEVWNQSNICIHLAGNNHQIKNKIKDQEYFEVNTELTKRLFNQFLQSACETFIYMSSVKAAADTVNGVLTEEIVPNPKTVYGLSKLKAEQYLLSQPLPEGKRLYILRPCMVHGPGNKGNLNLLYSFVSKGIPYPFGAYQNQRSFLSVENLCFVIKEIIENKNIPSGIYNVADNQPLSTINLVRIIGEITSKPLRILKIPKYIIILIAKLGNVIPMPINTDRLVKLTENYVVSNEKIKRAMKKELPISTKQGIIYTLQSF